MHAVMVICSDTVALGTGSLLLCKETGLWVHRGYQYDNKNNGMFVHTTSELQKILRLLAES